MAIRLSQIQPDLMYSVSEAASLVELTTQTVRLHINDGILRAVKGKTGRWKISGKELLRVYVSSTKE